MDLTAELPCNPARALLVLEVLAMAGELFWFDFDNRAAVIAWNDDAFVLSSRRGWVPVSATEVRNSAAVRPEGEVRAMFADDLSAFGEPVIPARTTASSA